VFAAFGLQTYPSSQFNFCMMTGFASFLSNPSMS
jgi:hypothetical protein